MGRCSVVWWEVVWCGAVVCVVWCGAVVSECYDNESNLFIIRFRSWWWSVVWRCVVWCGRCGVRCCVALCGVAWFCVALCGVSDVVWFGVVVLCCTVDFVFCLMGPCVVCRFVWDMMGWGLGVACVCG